MAGKIRKIGRGNHGITISLKEYEKLLTYIKDYPTHTQAAITIGIDRNVLFRVLLTHRGSKYTIDKIKTFLNGHKHRTTVSSASGRNATDKSLVALSDGSEKKNSLHQNFSEVNKIR